MPTFFYDANCSFCAWSAEHLVNLTKGLTVRAGAVGGDVPVVVQEHIADHAVYLPGGGANAARLERAGSVDFGHKAQFGHKAIGAALRHCGRNVAVRFAGRVLLAPVLSPLFAGVYRLVANNRHRIGPALGLDACAVPQPDLGADEAVSETGGAGTGTGASNAGVGHVGGADGIGGISSATMNRPVLGE